MELRVPALVLAFSLMGCGSDQAVPIEAGKQPSTVPEEMGTVAVDSLATILQRVLSSVPSQQRLTVSASKSTESSRNGVTQERLDLKFEPATGDAILLFVGRLEEARPDLFFAKFAMKRAKPNKRAPDDGEKWLVDSMRIVRYLDGESRVVTDLPRGARLQRIGRMRDSVLIALDDATIDGQAVALTLTALELEPAVSAKNDSKLVVELSSHAEAAVVEEALRNHRRIDLRSNRVQTLKSGTVEMTVGFRVREEVQSR